MTYIDYWNQLWKIAEVVPLTSSEVALYGFLLNMCNRRYWKMPFPCSSVSICETLRMSRQTLNTARKHLASVGLISFSQGSSRFTPSNYSILDMTDKLTVDLTTLKNIDIDSDMNDSPEQNWEELKALLWKDDAWFQRVVDYLNKREKNIALSDVRMFLSDFLQYLELYNDTQKTIGEVRKYFLNWVVKRLEKPKMTNEKVSTGLVPGDNSVNKYVAMKERIGQ